MLISVLSKKSMNVVQPHETNQDIQPEGRNDVGAAKRLLEGEATTPPESKRIKIGDEETPDIDLDKGSYISRPSGLSEAKQKSQVGKQNEKNKGRRRGTRPQVGDDADHPKTPRQPKKQCAILIGFSGTGYAGMQM